MLYHKNIITTLIVMLTMLFSTGSVFAEEDIQKESTTVKIPVSCVSENSSESFVYTISNIKGDVDYQHIESDTLSLKDGETGDFEVVFTTPGNYSYEIRQATGESSDTTYDNTVYTVDVYVTEDEMGIMKASPIIYIDGDALKKDCCVFTNITTLPEPNPNPNTPNQPNKPTDNAPVNQGDNKGVSTGDVMRIGSFMTIAGMCAVVGVILVKRKRGEEQ